MKIFYQDFYLYIYTYIYIKREREGEGERVYIDVCRLNGRWKPKFFFFELKLKISKEK